MELSNGVGVGLTARIANNIISYLIESLSSNQEIIAKISNAI